MFLSTYLIVGLRKDVPKEKRGSGFEYNVDTLSINRVYYSKDISLLFWIYKSIGGIEVYSTLQYGGKSFGLNKHTT